MIRKTMDADNRVFTNITYFFKSKAISAIFWQKRSKALIVVLVIAGALTGCESGAVVRQVTELENPVNELRIDMIADLISVLPQLLEPLNTTIQINEVESGNIAVAITILADLGYGMQRVDADQGNHFLYLSELPASMHASSKETRFRLSIGELELTRSYRIVNKKSAFNVLSNMVWRNGGAALPVGALKIAGTRRPVNLTGINVEIAQYGAGREIKRSDEFMKGSVEYTDLAPIKGIPTISLITEDLVKRITAASAGGPSLKNLKAEKDYFNNMFNGDSSAYTSVLNDYNRIIREFVIFPNDSQKLGRSGKLVVKKMINRFSDRSDIIGITGCSNGPTSLAIGNEGLAQGRANRITEEFVAAGVSRESVFDEGCWSPATNAPGFPNRGVVIDLWRRTS